MPSVLELAEICNASYDFKPKVSGWELAYPTFNFTRNGFFGAILRKSEEHVMVFRGTNDLIKDVVSDTTLALGFPPQQYYSAKQALSIAINHYGLSTANLTLTGHSLGGGLASMVSARDENLPVVTFNSPGMYRATTNAGVRLASKYNYSTNKYGIKTYVEEFKKVLHIRSEGDLVSIGTGRKIINNNRTLANPICPKVEGWKPITRTSHEVARALCAHSMDNMLTIIKNIPEFNEDILWI